MENEKFYMIFLSKNGLKYYINFNKISDYYYADIAATNGRVYRNFIAHNKIWWADNYDKLPNDIKNIATKIWEMKSFI